MDDCELRDAHGLQCVSDGGAGETIVHKCVVDGNVLSGDQLDRFVCRTTTDKSANRVQLTATITTTEPR